MRKNLKGKCIAALAVSMILAESPVVSMASMAKPVDLFYNVGGGGSFSYMEPNSQTKTVDKSQNDTVSTSCGNDKVSISHESKKTSEDQAQVSDRMSGNERAALIQSLKADRENQVARFREMVYQMLTSQGITSMKAEDDDFWRQIASGNFTVDAKTKAEAQAAIAEDGYWGVKQTSQRIFDFIKALVGDDKDIADMLLGVWEKSYSDAIKYWDKTPDITKQTYNAVIEMIENWE